ncbi:translocation/assembly module TamB domain-containing protein [Psychroflexus tropicus]|uniref:translocation/assembly module TamB domain-containing protein n=1 Tax=Psychroflexus tropicus TaxID=197345 RepID=UPI0003808C1C|nr:translocation/assembly module TamB [Psychroflexus tropicus]
MTETQPKKRSIFRRILKIFLRIALALFIIFILLVLFIRSPWGQDLIVEKVTNYVSDKIDTEFDIGKLYITFSGNVTLEDLYLEDKSQDTLVYSKYLEANVPFRPLLLGDEIKIDFVNWRGLKANISREDSIQGYNFQYIVDAFASEEQPQQKNDSSTTSFSIGSISFSDFKLSFDDRVIGINSDLDLGQLEIESNAIDLQNSKFDLDQIHLKNTTLNYTQSATTAPEENSEESLLPWILIEDLSLTDVTVNYESIPDKTTADVFINKFDLNELDANLNAQQITLDKFVWNDSNVKVELNSTNQRQEDEKSTDTSTAALNWPKWTVNINEIDFENHDLELFQNDQKPVKGKFSAEALALSSVYLNLTDIHFSKDESLNFNLNDFRFQEKSGLNLKELKVNSSLTSEQLLLEGLRFELNNSLLYADLQVNYQQLQALLNTPGASSFNLNVSRLRADLNDAFVFSEDLKKNQLFQQLSVHQFDANFIAQGNLQQLKVPEFDLDWGESTHLNFEGELISLDEPERLGLDITAFEANSTQKDLSRFVSEKDLGIALPSDLALTGSLRKDSDNYRVDTQLKSSFGQVQLKGFFRNDNNISYNVDFDIEALKLDQLLKNDQLGSLNMQLSSQGEGNSINELNAELTSKIDSVSWKAYTFSGLEIKGDLKNGKGQLASDYKDKNLQFSLDSEIKLDSVSPSVDMTLNLEGIAAQQLGLTRKDIRAKVLANISFQGNTNRFDLKTQLKEGQVVYDDRPYYLGDVDVSAQVDSTRTKASVTSSFLNGELKANSDIAGITEALQNHFKLYTKDSTSVKTTKTPIDLDLELAFVDVPIISDVFVDGIQQMDSLQVSIHFHEAQDELTSNLNLPYLNYKDNELNGLQLKINSNGKSANFNFGFDKISAGPLEVATTKVEGVFKDQSLNLQLDAFKGDKDFFNSSVSVEFEENNQYRINISPEELILNGTSWNISSENEIIYQKDSIRVDDFRLTRNNQSIQLRDDLEFEKNHIGVVFENFKLSTITNYLNPEEKIAAGKLSGRVVVLEPLVTNGLISNLNIEDLKLTEVPLGNLALKAEANSEDDYQLDLSLNDAGIELIAEGLYHTNEVETNINLNFDLKKLEMNTLEKFATDFIQESKGKLEGKLEIKGSPGQLDYEGLLGFNAVELNLKPLNTLLQLQDETIKLNNNTINFDSFTIRDVKGNTFTTDGSVDIENLTNPEFNLTLNAKDFLLLDSNIEDNDLYFGKLIFDADADITGELDFPKVNLDLSIKEATDLNYIIPESTASIDERDGVVVFVNKENPDDILTQRDKKDFEVVLTGVDLDSSIKIDNKAKVKVVFNKRSGDNVLVQGGGDFKFDISRTGKMDLVGKYKVSKGSVELNLYNIVKRKFNIASSSSVTWSGDPYNAKLDLRAIYNIETSASALMASQTAGESVAVQNRYRQQLPFEVYLDVGGELTSPQLSFQLDMPESQRGAINGSVYGRLSQINQQEDQLNKQVFSLLVLNRFYPDAGSDGSRGGPATMARDNLNQALSDQLNAFSDKLTGNTGISLNFDVNSYTDYQGSTVQDRTNVDVTAQKKLLDDRLVVEAGSSVNVEGGQRPGESQSVVGNVNVEYLLTEDGRWKLRGFRKSEYENVIDGQVFVSGIALIFTREFNKFKVLWNKAYRESLKEEEIEVKNEKTETEDDKN